MKKRILVILSLVIIISLYIPACSSTTEQKTEPTPNAGQQNEIKPMELHVGLQHTKVHIFNRTMEHFKKLLAEKSNGAINLIIHTDSELGNEPDMIEMLNGGSLDMCICNTISFDAYSKALTPLSFPMLIPDRDKFRKFYSEVIVPNRFPKIQEETGCVPLGIFSCGWRYMYSSKPLNSVEDLKGLKKRVMQTPYHIEAHKALGENPVAMPFGEVYTALQLKTVDMAANEAPSYIDGKYYEVAPYLVTTQHCDTYVILSYSKTLFNQLDPKVQSIIKEAADESMDYAWSILDNYENESFDRIKQLPGYGKTVNIIDWTDAERAKMQEIILNTLLEKFKDDLGDDVNQWLDANK